MTRLYIYAADSMRGREAGTPDAIRATAYIEREVRRLGLKPAGDNGTYFQNMPVTARVMSSASTHCRGRKDVPRTNGFRRRGRTDRKVTGDVVFGGTMGDTTNALSADDVRGKIVVMLAPAGGGGRGGFGGRGGGWRNNPLAGAEAIVTVAQTLTPPRAQFTLNDTAQTRRACRVCRGESGAGRTWWAAVVVAQAGAGPLNRHRDAGGRGGAARQAGRRRRARRQGRFGDDRRARRRGSGADA